ncbi:hypothetical protein AC579_6765 [Pseudocercospora musae]|uniref:Cercosporin MFS transporter CTB4 n=1 Tax=Pseudocercospora musae TaxID=113226 RepID=A0A139HFE8_9PEZI|nr:hypothetical protein AC579_6765 [Pseudocercospora musae]
MDSDTSFTKEAEIAERRPSHMSIEPPLSPVSTCSDSILIASPPSRHSRHSQDFAENALQPHLSRTSSTNAVGGIVPTRTWTQGTAGTAGPQDMAFEVDFDENTRENPQDWSLWYKCTVIAIFSFATTSSVLYSTSYTSAIPGMVREWGLSEIEGILGVTTYLLGLATGAVALAPLSEMYGRRIVYLITVSLFVVLVIPCAVAKNITTVLVTRFFAAFCAAAMISNAPGTVNDIVDEDHRALAFSIWSIGPINGPVLGPTVGGFVYEYLGWRWTNWVVAILSGVAGILVASVPETYAPALLRRKAHKKRKETGDKTWWSRYDDSEDFWPLLKALRLDRQGTDLVRSLQDSCAISKKANENHSMFWDVYVALVYGVLYLCFVAYPIVFRDLRGWSPGFTGLSFCGIGIGGTTTILSEPLIRRMINAHKHDPETGRPYPEAMVSVVCIASVLIPAGEIIFAWTCTPNVHWIVPILAGIPFGAGNAGVFIYASNYLVQSYGIYAASALAGNAVFRSIMGATLPLAGPSLYRALGANWAGMLLGLLEALFIPIPFVFYRYGHKIRQKSTLIRQLAEDQRREARHRRGVEKSTRRAEAELPLAVP